MRKFLVKHFVLDYLIKIFGKYRNAPRASRIIFPVFCVTGYLVCTNDNFPVPTIPIWIMYAVTLLVLYFGFVHFKLYPAKWEELDDFQKYQYSLFKPLTDEQKLELADVLKRLKLKYPDLLW